MNEFLDDGWVERVDRLALGLEPVDAARRARIGAPVAVAFDGAPLPPGRRPPGSSPWEEFDRRERLGRRDSCRHVLLLRPGLRDPLELRLTDRRERFVPRRLRVFIPPAPAGRVCRPALFPGAAYDVPAGAMGVRGRILRGGVPLRWCRAEARREADDVRVGIAHGDAKGEFLLLLDPRAAVGAELTLPVRVRVTVFGPDVPPAGTPAERAADPLWDLPRQDSPLPADARHWLAPPADPLLAGETLPGGYVSRPGSTRVVEVAAGRLMREEFDFS